MSTALATKSVITDMAISYGMEREAFLSTIKKTVMPSDMDVSNEELVVFLVAAREYKLNPFLKEIYAAKKKGGGIQTIVGVDGWSKIVNSREEFDGAVLIENFSDESKTKLESVTCRIFRKDRKYPTEITEYMSECYRDNENWRTKPVRNLRHKALIQCARYAFGLGGIIDPDEAERVNEIPIQAERATLETRRRLAKELSGGNDDGLIVQGEPIAEPVVVEGKTNEPG